MGSPFSRPTRNLLTNDVGHAAQLIGRQPWTSKAKSWRVSYH